MEEHPKWWLDPRGLVSAIAIVTTVLTFFYLREKKMWDQDHAIGKLEERGGVAIAEVKAELRDLKMRITTAERAIWELEHIADKQKRETEPP